MTLKRVSTFYCYWEFFLNTLRIRVAHNSTSECIAVQEILLITYNHPVLEAEFLALKFCSGQDSNPQTLEPLPWTLRGEF